MKKTEAEVENKIKQIENSTRIQESLVFYFNSNYSWNIDRKTIFEALFLVYADKYDFHWQGDIWDIPLDYDEALNLLSDFDFRILKEKIETGEDIIPKEYLIQYKVQIKSKGLIWIIHKYDADPFPSNPHAHELVNNLKLDLSTGKCYRRKDYKCTLKEKDLISIRNQAIDRIGIDLPPLKLD